MPPAVSSVHNVIAGCTFILVAVRAHSLEDYDSYSLNAPQVLRLWHNTKLGFILCLNRNSFSIYALVSVFIDVPKNQLGLRY